MKWRIFWKRYSLYPFLHSLPNPYPILLLTTKHDRGVVISTHAWKSALEHAERLVSLAETKLIRQKRACASRIAKLHVIVFLSCLSFSYLVYPLHSCSYTWFILILSPLQAEKVSLQINERIASKLMHNNNQEMKKVSLPNLHPNPDRNPNLDPALKGTKGARCSETDTGWRDCPNGKSCQGAHLARRD